ncbi:MAG: 50S ribosomal protein L10 [bacterium]
MANTKIIQSKELEVNNIVEKINGSKTVIAFDYQGLSVLQFETLRNSVRESGCEIAVLKNNITRRAATTAGFPELADALSGPKAIVFSANDVVAPAKGLYEFSKENSQVQISCGIVEGQFADAAKLNELATLPSHEGLLTMLAAGLLGTVSQLAIGLHQITEKMEEAN